MSKACRSLGFLLMGVVVCVWGGVGTVCMAAEAATPILHVDDVHAGMKGYGLTIFSGAKIEAFPVEVVSVVSNSSPARSVIWIECPGKRLQKSGPVEGMSGSPIYLWTKPGKHEIGKGGRLVGAFAFGYGLSKGCLAGVQPIQYMLQIPSRIKHDSKEADADGEADAGSSGGSGQGLVMLDRLKALVAQRGGSGGEAAGVDLIDPLRRLLAGGKLAKGDSDNTPGDPRNALRRGLGDQDSAGVLGPDGDSAGVQALMLPMNVGSVELAQDLGPLLRPYGLNPVAGGGGLIAGKPPKRVHPDKVKLQPGSALVIPLAYGDLDLYGGGTVTDVLADGTVLGFGHPMFGQGSEALPMATGYVNFVVPRITTSFKMMGSLKIVGSLVEDESTGIAGLIGVKRFKAAPVSITVRYPGRPARHYHYHVVNHTGLTSAILAAVTIQSINNVHQLPNENTLHLKGSLSFTGNRTLELNAMAPAASPMAILSQLIPIVATMTQNQHKRLKLTGMNLTATVQPKIELATLTNARMNRTVIAPGKTLMLTVELQPYGKKLVYRRIALKIPPDVPDGDYPVMISGAQGYAAAFVATHPYLFQTRTVDDIYHTIKKLLAIRDNRIYVTMRLPKPGLAVGRTALPNLPSSRAALIAAPTNTYATPYTQALEQSVKVPRVVDGAVQLTVHVRTERNGNFKANLGGGGSGSSMDSEN